MEGLHDFTDGAVKSLLSGFQPSSTTEAEPGTRSAQLADGSSSTLTTTWYLSWLTLKAQYCHSSALKAYADSTNGALASLSSRM